MSGTERYRSFLAEPSWERSAMERAVQRAGRIMRAINAEKDWTTRDAQLRDAELVRRSRETFIGTAADMYEAEEKITDPRVRRLTQTLDQELLQTHKQHLVGYYLLAGEQFAGQIARDITPEAPKPQSYWQQVALAVLGD